MIDNKTGYIKINRFASNTYREFLNATKKLLNNGMESLVLDLRNNPGGYLESAINICNEFLDKNLLIVYTKNRSGERTEYFSNDKGLLIDMPVKVIIDEGSASASEIVAGALQDNDIGTIIGRRSFGKGLVQEQFENYDGSAYRITTQRYYTPTGRCIQRPYIKGQGDTYGRDYLERLNNGELLSIDNIKFNDSLKFTTKKGKVVYGGGGIMPDIFIPLDTLSYHHSISKAIRKDFIRQFAFKYTNKNRSKLELQNLAHFISLFEITSADFKDFTEYCKSKDLFVPISKLSDYDKKILSTQLKAYIARNIWNDEGFFPIIHKIDYTFQEALLK